MCVCAPQELIVPLILPTKAEAYLRLREYMQLSLLMLSAHPLFVAAAAFLREMKYEARWRWISARVRVKCRF